MSGSTVTATRPATLEMTGISKNFAGVAALTDVSVSFVPGEIHAILGENGAGKSTLMNIASGVLQPDTGTITIDGRPVGSDARGDGRGFGDCAQHAVVSPQGADPRRPGHGHP